MRFSISVDIQWSFGVGVRNHCFSDPAGRCPTIVGDWLKESTEERNNVLLVIYPLVN